MALLSSPLQIITNTPRATKIITAIIISSSIGYSYLRYTAQGQAGPVPWLLFVPGESWLYPWTLLTAGFIEINLIQALGTILTIPPALRYLERLWGAFETAKFVAIVVVISNLIAFFVNWLEYAVLGSEIFLKMEYHGMMALQVGVLVAFTQLIPEHQLQFFGQLKIRVKQFPMIYVTISNIACILGIQSPYILIQFGWLVSWAYLRFYKRTTDALSGIDTYGDRSETFAFIYWFPPFVHKPLSVVSKFVHDLAVKFKVIRPFTLTGDELESGVYSQLSTREPGGARAEAERRRALALKALDSRLAAGSNPRPSGTTPRPGPSATTSNVVSSSSTTANGPTRKSTEQGKGKTASTDGE